MDDIVITGDDIQEISDLKSLLQQKFQTEDLRSLRYFLRLRSLDLRKGSHFLSESMCWICCQKLVCSGVKLRIYR